MQVYVCLKHVPDTAANINLVGETSYNRSIKYDLNPYDEHALEEAVRIGRRTEGEVVVVTIGSEDAMSTIRSALARGADRGILVRTDDLLLDSMTTSLALKEAILRDGRPDIILTGKQSIDSEGMQTHYRLAAALDMPVANEVSSLNIEDGYVTVESELGGGKSAVLELDLPCILGASKALNEPGCPKLPAVLKAKKKPVKEIDLSDLKVVPPKNRPELLKLDATAIQEKRAGIILNGKIRDSVAELIKILKEKEMVI